MAWPSKKEEKKPEPLKLPEGLKAEVEGLISHYPNKRAALIPALHKCQERFGYITESVTLALAEYMELPPSHVADTISFYSMLRTKPAGKYHIEVCQTVSCALRGADSLADYLSGRLAIGFGEVTPDGRFSLGKVECIGACEQAPAILINNELYGNLDREKIDGILDGLR